MELLYLVIGILVGITAGMLVQKIKNIRNEKQQRKQAVQKSKQVITGQVAEQVAPLLPHFPAHVKDVKFLGQPVDYIAYNGLHANNITGITFIEIKTNNAQLNAVQRQIKKCIEQKKVSWITHTIKAK